MHNFFKYEWVLGYAAALAGWVFSFLVPISSFLVITVALVMCDLYTGTKAAKKRNEKINSKGLKRTVEKISLYFVAILLSEGIRVVFLPPVPLAYATAFAITITEFKSNIENVEAVTGVNIWTTIKGKLGI